MNVLHMIDTLWLGGAQAVERDYFESQQNNGKIFLYVLRKSTPQITINHPNIFIENSSSRFSLYPIFNLRRFIKKNNIEIIHCHLLRSHLFGYLIKRLFCPDIKLVIHEHSDIMDNAGLSIPILKLIRQRVNLFLACSNALKTNLLEKISIEDKKVMVLYNGINLLKFNKLSVHSDVPEEKKKLNIREGEFVVGFIGRLTRRKGWKELVETANQLKADSSIRFLIAGDGEDKEQLLNLISSNKLDNITYLGYVSSPERFYSLLSCLAVPSHYEPMGITAIEAQAMEVPVIASNVDGLNEIVNNENAILFEPRIIQELTKAILRLRDDSALYESLKGNGIKNAKNYSIEAYVQKIDTIYNSLSTGR